MKTEELILKLIENWDASMGREPSEIVLNPCRLDELKNKEEFMGIKIIALPEVDPKAIYLR